MGSGDVWVHDARLRPSLTMETESIVPVGDDGREVRETTRVVIEEPSEVLIREAFDRFWFIIQSEDDK